MATVADNPALEVEEAIVAHLRALADAGDIPCTADQIRRRLDISGEPKGLSGIVVAVADRGDHAGCVGRVLVDVAPEVSCWSHLDEDADGSACDALAGAAMAAMQTITYNLPGWRVAWRGSWTRSAPTAADAFRTTTISATLPLVRRAGGETSTSASTNTTED